MVLNLSNSSNLEQLALKALSIGFINKNNMTKICNIVSKTATVITVTVVTYKTSFHKADDETSKLIPIF